MRHWLYNTAITVAAPAAATYLAFSRSHRALLGRFSPSVPPMPSRPVWVHACSVGEIGVAQPLLLALRERYPVVPLLLTVSTATGMARAKQLSVDAAVAWFPFDQPFCVSRFLQRATPRMLLLIETELWPNILRLSRRHKVPAIVVNGRLSDRHYRRYLRGGRMVRDMFRSLNAAGVQDDRYAERFGALGLDDQRISVTGNIKFDGVGAPLPSDKVDALRTECAIPSDVPVVIFGSTRPGDERAAIECWHALRERGLDPYLIVAPRHIERAPEIIRMFDDPVQLRSRSTNESSVSARRALVVDTHGELFKFYALADVAVMGGSFDSAIQGHNPIEPAALSVPAVFGPHMRNFAGAADALVEANGAIRVSERSDLSTAVERLLHDPDAADRMGQAAQQVVQSNRGALQRTIELVERTVPHLAD